MADALCGPSNALQNFQKHTQGDRTLQQDRLALRHNASQGFRSATPNAGILDPEFEAFQAGLPAGPPQFQSEPLRPIIPPQAPQQQAAPSPALGGWASDFQRLHISSPRPSSAHQTHAPSTARQSPAASASWHTDFMQSSAMPAYQPQQTMQPSYSWANQMPMQMGHNPFQSVSQGKQKEPVAEDPMDMAAFERAFDAARQEMLDLEAEAEAEAEAQKEMQQDDTGLDSVTRELQEETNHLAALENSRLHQLHDTGPSLSATDLIEQLTDHRLPDQLMEEQSKEEEKPAPEDDDELSQVAGQLLDSVSHETSEKFQSSVFLQLMRRLRDKEVRVEGENFVETGTSSPAPLSSVIPPSAIPPDEQDLDNGRFGVDVSVSADALPIRPLTPEIDPPAPTLAQWRRLYGLDTPS